MSYIVTLEYDPVWPALDWVKDHCNSYITNDVHQDGYDTYDLNKIDYFFGDEKDATLFRLRWV